MKTKSRSPRAGSDGIDALRERIDGLDRALLKLISRRGALAKRIGTIKKKRGEGVYVPSREKQIFDRLTKINDGPYRDASVFAIFREIISATRALEEPTRVAFLGPVATFTHMAAVRHFGSSATFCAQSGIAEVFSEVEKAHADYGVVPVENSTEGVVNYTLDKFVESDLKICSEIIIPVAHNLLSAEADLARVRRVYSHPQALSQCRQWLALNLPRAELKEADSTSSAARRIAREKGAAAIASRFAADMYGLNILASDIQDQVKNFTRFLVIGGQEAGRTGNDKTSLAFVAKDRAGVLYRLLRPLAEAKINLTKIESRPLKKRAWEYMFFVDLDGHVSERRIMKALAGLREECESFKILGSYPKSARVS
jgi:chorismate mutase/prephenate dehydratase